jgi:hypothetical protein
MPPALRDTLREHKLDVIKELERRASRAESGLAVPGGPGLAGEALAIQGAMKAGVYEKNGEHRASLNVAASHVLALRQPGRAAGAPFDDED